MAVTKYYKTTDAKALAAWSVYKKELASLYKQVAALAKEFKGKPFYYNTFGVQRFAGLRFDSQKDDTLWRKPSSNTGLQDPRLSLPRKVTAGKSIAAREALQRQLDELRAKWKSLYPTIQVRSDLIWNELVVNSGNLLVQGPSAVFVKDGVAYVRCSVEVLDHLEEISGSEYEEALAEEVALS